MSFETAFCFAHLLFFITDYARRASLILWERSYRVDSGRAYDSAQPLGAIRCRIGRRTQHIPLPQHAAGKQQIESRPEILKGWQQIVSFLGEPISVVQRWADEAMPVRREGRFVAATPEELNDWLGK